MRFVVHASSVVIASGHGRFEPAITLSGLTPYWAAFVEWWGRDPASNPSPTMLSNAHDFLIGP